MPCEECGFSHQSLPVDDASAALRELGRRYRIPLSRGLKGEDLDALLRAHPLEGTWSALEYACHYRDVLAVQRQRLETARAQDGYAPEPMRREERVTEIHYNEQDPAAVADDVATNAAPVADLGHPIGPGAMPDPLPSNFPPTDDRPPRRAPSPPL